MRPELRGGYDNEPRKQSSQCGTSRWKTRYTGQHRPKQRGRMGGSPHRVLGDYRGGGTVGGHEEVCESGKGCFVLANTCVFECNG